MPHQYYYAKGHRDVSLLELYQVHVIDQVVHIHTVEYWYVTKCNTNILFDTCYETSVSM